MDATNNDDLTMSVYGSLEEIEAERARRAATPSQPAAVSAPSDERAEIPSWQNRCDWLSNRPATQLMVEAMKAEITDLRSARAAAPVSGPTDADRYQLLRRKVCIAGGKFHILNLDPIYLASHAEIELDAAIDAQILSNKE